MAQEIIGTLYNFTPSTVEGFFRRTLKNMKDFYFKVDKIKLIKGI